MKFYYKDPFYFENTRDYINKIEEAGLDYEIEYIWDFETDEEIGIEIISHTLT